MTQQIPTNAVYNDLQGLASLRANAANDPQAAVKEAAQQFEALFIQILLKESRSSSFGDPLFGSNDADTYRDLFDQQISLTLSQKGDLGIAETIVNQLSQQLPEGGELQSNPFSFSASTRLYSVPQASVPAPSISNDALPIGTAETTLDKQQVFESPFEFVSAVLPHARRVGEKLGVPAEAIVAQAALETGWGKHVIRNEDGSSSFNLFGIKADQRWSGDTARVTTTEYKDGIAYKQLADFRSYGSIAESVEDYANFLKTSPRYEKALSATDAEGFLGELQKAGYATDPAYAQKINGIASGEVMSQALAALNI